MESGLPHILGLCRVGDPVRPVEMVLAVPDDASPPPEEGGRPHVVEGGGHAALDAGPTAQVVGTSEKLVL